MTDERTARIAAELDILKQAEAAKRQLFDKSIGGPMALRPSDDFIRESVGALKDEATLIAAATKRVEAQMATEAQDSQAKDDFKQSVIEHNAELERQRESERVRALMHAMNDRDRGNEFQR